MRPKMLSALWGITLAWAKAGRPLPKHKKSGYEPWSDTVAGILEHAGYASPCTSAPNASASGDRDTEDMEKLVRAMPLDRELRFIDIVDLCRAHGLFTRLVAMGGEDFEPGKKNIFSRILTKFNARLFTPGIEFCVQRRSKDVSVFYTKAAPKSGVSGVSTSPHEAGGGVS